jgi:hypothetical protein
MDFMKWLNSLGELLYEVMSWLIFYPITLWRTLVKPLEMMRYADDELNDRPDEQFTDTLNPPLFLVLSLLLTQGLDVALGGGTNPIVSSQRGLATLVNDNTTLLVLRLVVFAMFPLMMSARFLRAKHIRLTRDRLRGPFYAQCYACAPFALFLGLGISLSHTDGIWVQRLGHTLALSALLIYLATETRWFAHHLQRGLVRSAANVVRAFLQGAVAAIALGALFVLQ